MSKIVLIVDDEPGNIELLRGVLPAGLQIKVAIRGDKALGIARKAPPPDLIFLDVMMPEMDGYEVCRQLKADPATSSIPVAFLSGHTSEDEKSKGLALGACTFLSKPIDPMAIRKVVLDVLGTLE